MDLGDIQGNIVKAYGRYGFPVARHIFYHVTSAEVGRQFVADITPLVTTSIPWLNAATIPPVAINIAFTYEGLRHLDVPEETLHGFSDEFSMGMKARRDIIGDTGPNHFSRWDPIWNSEEHGEAQHVHILISINAKTEADCRKAVSADSSRFWRGRSRSFPRSRRAGVTQLTGHRGAGGDDLPYQPAAALAGQGTRSTSATATGSAAPFSEDCGEDPIARDRRRQADRQGSADARRLGAARAGRVHPWARGRVGALSGGPGAAAVFAQRHVPGLPEAAPERRVVQLVPGSRGGARFPGGKEALAAKFAGRWRNGAPLALFPTRPTADRFVNELTALTRPSARRRPPRRRKRARLDELKLQLVAFDYNDDLDGAKCPFGAHTRRTNPRSALEFGTKGRSADRPPGAHQPAPDPSARPALRPGRGATDRRRRSRRDHDDPERRSQPPVRVRAAAVDQLRQRLPARQRQGPDPRQPRRST